MKSKTGWSAIILSPRVTSAISNNGSRRCKPMWSSWGQAPHLAAADRGFWNGANEKAAAQLGVKQVVLPARGRLNPSRALRQKQRWFRRGQSWRAGLEARLSTLKHCFGMGRAFYKGEIGFERHVGWCIIAHNLVAMSRASLKAAHARCRSGCSHV